MAISQRQVRAFQAVVMTGSMTEAARMLSVTQPAVSRLVRELEEELGFALFTRRKGGLSLSDEAQALYVEIERSFIGLDKIAQTARQIRDRTAGELRIGGLPALSISFVPRVVAEFLADHPHVTVSLQTHNSPRVVELVRMQQFDLGLTMTPIDTAGVVVDPVLRSHCVCILPPGHRLAARDVIAVKDLRDEPFISLAQNTMTRFKIDAVFKDANVPRRLQIETRISATICSFVAAGLGVSIIEPFTATEFTRRGGIVRPFLPPVEFTFAIVYPALKRSHLATAFEARLLQALGPYLVA